MNGPSSSIGGWTERSSRSPAAPEPLPITLPPPPPPASHPNRLRIGVVVAGIVVLALGTALALALVRGTGEEDVAASPKPTTVSTSSPSPGSSPTSSPVASPSAGPQLVAVGGYDLRVMTVTFQDSWDSGFDTVYEPTGAGNTFLVVAGRIEGDVDLERVQAWKVVLSGQAGRRIEPFVTSTSWAEGKDGKVEWVFVVREGSSGFTLVLPGGHEVDLAPVLSP